MNQYTLFSSFCHSWTRQLSCEYHFFSSYTYKRTRRSHQRCWVEKAVLQNFSIFTGKHLRWSFFSTKMLTFLIVAKALEFSSSLYLPCETRIPYPFFDNLILSWPWSYLLKILIIKVLDFLFEFAWVKNLVPS